MSTPARDPRRLGAGLDARSWRDDLFGASVRDGLEDLRASRPSPQLWQAIARELEPDEPSGRLARWLGRAGGATSSTGLRGERGRLWLAYTSLASVLGLVYSLALGSLIAGGRGVQPFACDGDCRWDSLSTDELARQRSWDPRGVDAYPGWVFQVRPSRNRSKEGGTDRYEDRYWIEWGHPARTGSATREALAFPGIVMD